MGGSPASCPARQWGRCSCANGWCRAHGDDESSDGKLCLNGYAKRGGGSASRLVRKGICRGQRRSTREGASPLAATWRCTLGVRLGGPEWHRGSSRAQSLWTDNCHLGNTDGLPSIARATWFKPKDKVLGRGLKSDALAIQHGCRARGTCQRPSAIFDRARAWRHRDAYC